MPRKKSAKDTQMYANEGRRWSTIDAQFVQDERAKDPPTPYKELSKVLLRSPLALTEATFPIAGERVGLYHGCRTQADLPGPSTTSSSSLPQQKEADECERANEAAAALLALNGASLELPEIGPTPNAPVNPEAQRADSLRGAHSPAQEEPKSVSEPEMLSLLPRGSLAGQNESYRMAVEKWVNEDSTSK